MKRRTSLLSCISFALASKNRYNRTDVRACHLLTSSFAAVYKTYTMVSGRRFASDLRGALAKGYISKLLSYNSIFDYFQMESLTPYLRQLIEQSALPLQSIEEKFAVDSSGFSTSSYVRWFDVKYGNNEDWHDWVKMHLICGVKTHVVASVEITRALKHDSPYFKPLVEQAVTADST